MLPASPNFNSGTKMVILVVALPSFQVPKNSIAWEDRPVSCIYISFSRVLFLKLIHMVAM